MVNTGELYVSAGDTLRITSWSSQATYPVYLVGRIRGLGGNIAPQQWAHTPLNDRSARTEYFALAEGGLLSLAVHVDSAAVLRGQTFAVVELCRGRGTPAIPLHVLIAGYVCRGESPGWPEGPLRGPGDGPGYVRRITGTDPAPDAEFSESVPTGAVWRLRSLRVQCVTSALVNNRACFMVLTDGATTLWRSIPTSYQAASLTNRYNAGVIGHRATGVGNELEWNLPADLMLQAGWTITSYIWGKMTGDDWGAPELVVEEWLQP